MLLDDQLEHGPQVRLGALRLGEARDVRVVVPALAVGGVGTAEVIDEQPATGPQQLLDQEDRKAVYGPVLLTLEKAEVVERLAVARSVGALLDLLLAESRPVRRERDRADCL
jgi:hypothetical protein